MHLITQHLQISANKCHHDLWACKENCNAQTRLHKELLYLGGKWFESGLRMTIPTEQTVAFYRLFSKCSNNRP
jgi:hypothetical protein